MGKDIRVLKEKHIEPYKHYGEHCHTLYRKVLEPFGFEYDIDLSKCDQAEREKDGKQK